MRLVLASGNAGKLAELRRLLTGFDVVAQGELGVEDAVEDGSTFVENALIKARHAARATGCAAIADDSGLCVDALGGAPGLYSARYAGEPRDDQRNNDRLLEAMRDVPDAARGCAFVCVVALLPSVDSPLPVIGQGVWRGRLVRERRGAGGFGYDPLFVADGEDLSAAQMAPDEKAVRSHRGRALRALEAALAMRPDVAVGA